MTPKKKEIQIQIEEPKSQMEALTIVSKAWMWLVKNNPIVFAPLTAWMLFGGFYFGWKIWVAPTFEIKEAKPIGAEFSIMPKSYAGGIPIQFNGKTWGYADTTFIAIVRSDEPSIVVYDKKSKKVWTVDFNSMEDIRKQMRK